MRTAAIKIISMAAMVLALYGNIIFAAESVSTNSTNKGYIDSDYCKHLLNTDMYGWTSECSLQKGGSQNRMYDPRRTQYEDKGTSQWVPSYLEQNPSIYRKANPSIANDPTIGILNAKVKCKELGFNPGKEDFGKCVLQLSK